MDTVSRFLRGLLLAFALALASSAQAQEAYSGPNDDPAATYGWTSVVTMGTCNGAGGPYTAAQAHTCVQAWVATNCAGGSAGFVAYGNSAGTITSPTLPVPGVPNGTQIHVHLDYPANCGWASVASGIQSLTCASNRSLAVSGALAGRCVSKCYSLRGNSVSAFVPISDPAQSVPAACLFLVGTGTCQIEATDTSNYTYGSQLYRGGTWIHVGQQCVEDASAPVSDGAINQSPTGGTGLSGGLTSNEGNTAATRDAMVSDIEAADDSLLKGFDDAKKSVETGRDDQLFLKSGETRWIFGLAEFMPVGDPICETSAFNLPTANGNTTPVKWNLCSRAPMVKDFLSWVFGFLTAFGVWTILFGGSREPA